MRRSAGKKASMARASTRPAPERIGDHYLAVAHRLYQAATPRREAALSSSGSAKSASIRRSSTSVRRRPEMVRMKTPVVAHDQVFALDQQQAEIARQISVLEIGFVHRPGRQQTDARVVLPVIFEQLGLERLEERRHAFDARGAIDVGNGARPKPAGSRSRKPAPDGACARSPSTHQRPSGPRPTSTA